GHQHQQADGAGHDRERTEREQGDACHGRTSAARSDRLATTASASRVYRTGWASWKGGRSRCSARGFRTMSQKWYANTRWPAVRMRPTTDLANSPGSERSTDT